MTRSRAAESPAGAPSLTTQEEFWDGWNREWRFGELDAFMNRQRDVAVSLAEQKHLRDARILDVGCGTGWLANALLPFGTAYGTDLSPDAIREGAARHPGVRLLCGDFLGLS